MVLSNLHCFFAQYFHKTIGGYGSLVIHDITLVIEGYGSLVIQDITLV